MAIQALAAIYYRVSAVGLCLEQDAVPTYHTVAQPIAMVYILTTS